MGVGKGRGGEREEGRRKKGEEPAMSEVC